MGIFCYPHLHGIALFCVRGSFCFLCKRGVPRIESIYIGGWVFVGAILAPLCTGVALTVAIHAGRRSYLANPASFTNLGVRPLAMDFGTSLMFLLLVAIALYLRRRPDFHNRVMVLACCSILLPAIGRIPYVWDTADWGSADDTVGFWGLVAVTEIPPLGCILYDTIKHRRLHPAFAWGGAAVLASFPAFMLIGVTDPWLRFMIWLLSR